MSAGKAILCLTCYKNFNKFLRSDDSLNELSKTDDYQLTKCFQFDQVEYCNVDSDNLDHFLEFVVSDFLSNKALLLLDLYKKIEDLVDKTALIKSLKEPEDKISRKWVMKPLPGKVSRRNCQLTVF